MNHGDWLKRQRRGAQPVIVNTFQLAVLMDWHDHPNDAVRLAAVEAQARECAEAHIPGDCWMCDWDGDRPEIGSML